MIARIYEVPHSTGARPVRARPRWARRVKSYSPIGGVRTPSDWRVASEGGAAARATAPPGSLATP